jgi:hypothetical protein
MSKLKATLGFIREEFWSNIPWEARIPLWLAYSSVIVLIWWPA